MKKKIDLTSGSILKTLIKISLPILGTSFIQMAYNMVDMIWIGRIGSDAVAAVGTAGFFAWFGFSVVLISKTGAEIGVSQSVGIGDNNKKEKYIYNSLFICVVLALLYTAMLLIFRNELIGFFNLKDDKIVSMAIEFLVVISMGTIFAFINPQFTGILTAIGDSKTPFLINTIGLITNIVLDPILIFGFGPIKPMGVIGAAFATVFSQFVVTLVFLYIFIKSGYTFKGKGLIKFKYIKRITKWGIPSALQNCLFAFFSMVIGRIVAEWGATPIAVQKVGSQIESISWMTASGFSSALTAFMGQNYGARAYNRVRDGYKSTLKIALVLGVFSTVLLVFAGDVLFSVFINEKEAIRQGTDYLRILGYSQLFMCIEITTIGAFYGIGKTIIPSIISIVFTGLRIPLAMVLSKPNILGIDGVWWSITVTTIIKGILLVAIFIILQKRVLDRELSSENKWGCRT